MKKELVTLAKTWTDKVDPTGMWASEKLDGMRALWNPETKLFTTRNNKPIYAPIQWTAGMPQSGPVLDGELFLGRGQFQKLISITRRQTPDLADWSRVRFMCFAVVDTVLPWVESFRVNPTPCCVPVAHHYVVDLEHMLGMYEQIVESGGEGLMLRNGTVPYQFYRSSDLLKVKPELSLECVVVGHTDGTGKYAGLVGALECNYFNRDTDRVVEFNVGSGLTDIERTAKYAPKPGSKIRINFQCFTDAGIPRFPRFIECV